MFVRALLILLALVLLPCSCCMAGSALPTASATIGFETPGQWHSVPQDVIAVNAIHPQYLWCQHVHKMPLALLDTGLTPSTDHVKEGRYSGLWKDHEKYPTIACWDIPHDWSAYNSFEISIYSERATGETVTLGALSDSAATPWKDYYLHDFVVDWRGWKTLTFPFSSFQSFEKPAGWNKIDGLFFFTKIFRHQPNPYTELSLDTIHLRTGQVSAQAAQPNPTNGFTYLSRYEDQQQPLNLPYPETDHEGAFTSPINQLCYFQAEREQFKYFPHFNAGYVSFDPSGKAYINAGETIEWLDASGKWTASDIKSVLVDWARKQGWKGLANGWGPQGAEPMIRFDRDGDAYALEVVEPLNAQGQRFDWKTRATLLLHSHDRMKTWQAYKLPDRVASFEKLDGHNQECLNRPPVILLGDYKYFGDADQAGYILIPEKQADGSLTLPKPVAYAAHCMDVNYHSGDANVAITHHGKVTIVFGWCPQSAAQTGDWRSTMPSIPDGHPGLTASFPMIAKGATTLHYGKDGVPTYVVDYDIASRTVSKPIYVGSGGVGLDAHNWPALTIDSRGILYVIMNGHHAPVNYTHTLRPDDISEWSTPQYLLVNTQSPNLSYATLTCGSDDTLYTVHRSTKDAYDNHLGLYRKRAGQEWEEERKLVVPFKDMYKVWYQRMTYDTKRNRLFLTYFANGGQEWYTWDMFDFYTFIWPDRERLMDVNIGKAGVNDAGPAVPGGFSGGFYDPGATEITMLVSDDEAQSWRLATTADFARK